MNPCSSGNTFAMLGILPTSLVLVTFIVFFLLPVLVVTFSNGFLGGQDSNAEEDVDFEMNFSRTFRKNFANGRMQEFVIALCM